MTRSLPTEQRDPLTAVADVLRRHDLEGFAARAAGSDGEVLLLRPPVGAAETALESPSLLQELRAAGFRYIALDLAPPAAEDVA